MRVRILVLHGAETRFQAGDIVDLPADEARAMLERGDAEAAAIRSVEQAERRPRTAKRETRSK